MATIKAFTDLEQSKKLAKFLPHESADMYWWSSGKRYYIEAIDDGDFNEEEDIPAWSLSALLGLIPTNDKKDEYYVDTESHSDYHTVSYRNCWNGCVHSEHSEESLLDAAFEMIVWLKENKKI